MSDPHADTAIYPPEVPFVEQFFAPGEPPTSLQFGAATHIGRVRPTNDDHFAIFRQQRSTRLLLSSLGAGDATQPEICTHVMAVADGMGGSRAGEFASRLVMLSLLELMGDATSWVMRLTDLDAQQIEQRVNAYVQRIQQSLRAAGAADPSKARMGTTWTSAHLMGRQALIVHVGDSRAYLLRHGRLRQLTRDHTLAQEYIDDGARPEQVARFRHMLVNSLCVEQEDTYAELRHLELEDGDQLLLCTDGLSNMLSETQIEAELMSATHPQAACDKLVQTALEAGGRDNITVALAWFHCSQPE